MTCEINGRQFGLVLYKQTFTQPRNVTIKGAGYAGDMVAAQNLVLLDPPAQATPPTDSAKQDSDQSPKAVLKNADVPGPAAEIAKNQTEIKGLEILEEDDGTELGQASELILTADPGSKSGDIPVSFASDVGPEMKLVLAELIRWSHVRYPKISGTDKIEYSFEDKYDKHEGGSIGAACGTLFLSMMQGFDIDPNLAMTGDVSADGKVRAIGGVAAKLRGAAVAGCTLVALPEENYEQLVDAEIYDGLPAVTDAQVLGISTLDSAAAVARVDRDSKLAQAIDLFTQIQQSMKQSPDYLKTAKAQTDLQQVLDLDPDHLSAKVLLSIAQGTARTRLTASASEYYTLVAVNFALPMINDQLKSGTKSPVLPAMVDESLNRLRLVHQRSDPHILPLIDAWHDWIQASSDYESGDASDDYLESKRLAVLDAMTKLQANRELIEKMLHEGM
ncbi:MAG: S16 family serine protease [Tepidisphaeraceae bacterium]